MKAFNERVLAVYVLQRFVRRSRLLLPGMLSLVYKTDRTVNEEQLLARITDVYESFRVEPQISVDLIDSNILSLIMDVYNRLEERENDSDRIIPLFDAFLQESDRLISVWDRQQMN